MDDDIDLAIKTIASKEDVSVNQLVAKALRRYVEWEILADKIGLVELHDKSLEMLFDSISDERARELGRDTGVNAWTDMVTFLHQGFNYTAILKMLELRGQYGTMVHLRQKLREWNRHYNPQTSPRTQSHRLPLRSSKSSLRKSQPQVRNRGNGTPNIVQSPPESRTRTSRTIAGPRRIRFIPDSDE